MRKSITSLLLGLGLVIAVAMPVAADTGGGEADLGLETVTISSATVNKAGTATVRGTVECSQDLEGVVWVSVQQNVGRFHTISGDGGDEITCAAEDGSVAFAAQIQPWQGKFGGGRATVAAFAETAICQDEGEDPVCEFDSAWTDSVQIRLRGGR